MENSEERRSGCERPPRCFALRDGDYGLVIHAGIGLPAAAAKLAGCARVDILLPDPDFWHLAGFLSVGNVCPGAEIRIFAPFNIMKFSVKPFWPVNLIAGTYEAVEEGTAVSLGSGYSAVFSGIGVSVTGPEGPVSLPEDL